MNWSKAKSILIIALIITNLLLLGIFFLDRKSVQVEENSRDFVQEVKEILGRKGIEVQAEIPRVEPSLQGLEVSYESLSRDELNERFFAFEGVVDKDQEGLLQIRGKDSKLLLVDNRRLFYEKETPQKGKEISLKEAEGKVKAFLQDRGFPVEDMKLVKKNRQEGGWDLVYTMIYQGQYVESSYSAFRVFAQGVASMDRLWINILREEDLRHRLEPAPKALLSLLDIPEAQGRKVVEIAPCHFFNPEKQGILEEITRSLKGKSSVSWRVVLDNGEELILSN